jgi:hypothetical protein
MDDAEARAHVGTCIRVDANNRMIGEEPEIPGPETPRHLANA